VFFLFLMASWGAKENASGPRSQRLSHAATAPHRVQRAALEAQRFQHKHAAQRRVRAQVVQVKAVALRALAERLQAQKQT
jgi:hypothetical protein